MSERESAAAEAARIIDHTGDRGAQYGPVEEDYQRVCDFFVLLTGVRLTPAQALAFMDCVKLSRMSRALKGDAPWKRDDATDLCGYSSLLNDVMERRVGGGEAPCS